MAFPHISKELFCVVNYSIGEWAVSGSIGLLLTSRSDLNVQTLHHAQHLTASVTELKASQDDFRHNALDEISRMSDAMQKVKISNDQGLENLHVGIDSIVNTSNAAISQQYQSLLEHIRVEFQNQFMAIAGQLDAYRKAVQGMCLTQGMFEKETPTI
jgi:F0F1-type ATP synthase membrane subunit b/b'